MLRIMVQSLTCKTQKIINNECTLHYDTTIFSVTVFSEKFRFRFSILSFNLIRGSSISDLSIEFLSLSILLTKKLFSSSATFASSDGRGYDQTNANRVE